MPGYARPTTVVLAQEMIFTPSGSLSSTTVADALAELDGDVSTNNSTLTTAVASKADTVAGGSILSNTQTISSNFTFPSNKNGVSAGPITIADGVTVTIPTGSEWSIV